MKEIISIVVPCYNEEESIPRFYDEINSVSKDMNKVNFEYIFVNDGSKDNTLKILKELNKKDKRVKYISFSRNFGKESAMYAGLEYSKGDYVAIMDADKEGFLRSETSLIQTIGRAARNACGEVIMYADRMTESMEKAIFETERRRKIQLEYNKKYGIIPQTIKKPIENNLLSLVASYRDLEDIVAEEMVDMGIDKKELPKLIDKLEKDMHKAAKILDFERAAEIRDKLKKLREMLD